METTAVGKSEGTSIPDMNFFVSNLSFKSMSGKYRFNSSMTAEALVLTLEKLKTPYQWQVVVPDITSHGPSGIPKDVVMSVLKESVHNQLEMETAKSRPFEKGIIDVEMCKDGNVQLCLTIPVAGIAKVSYSFEMVAVVRKPMDVLESLQKDSQDDIVQLKQDMSAVREDMALVERRMTKDFIFLRSSTNCQQGQFVEWNVPVKNSCDDIFQVSTDNTTVTVNKSGVYLISARLTYSAGSGYTATLAVFLNEEEICRQDNYSQNTCQLSIHVSEPAYLQTGAKLRIQYTNPYGQPSVGTAASNKFSIIEL